MAWKGTASKNYLQEPTSGFQLIGLDGVTRMPLGTVAKIDLHSSVDGGGRVVIWGKNLRTCVFSFPGKEFCPNYTVTRSSRSKDSSSVTADNVAINHASGVLDPVSSPSKRSRSLSPRSPRGKRHAVSSPNFSAAVQSHSISAQQFFFFLVRKLSFPPTVESSFAYRYGAAVDTSTESFRKAWRVYDLENEFRRQKVDPNLWRVCDNSDFAICETYPQRFVVPRNVTQKGMLRFQ